MYKADADFIRHALERHGAGVIRAAFAYVKNVPDAEDIAQDTFLALLAKRPEFDSAAHEKAWLLRVAANKAKNHLKRHWIRRRADLTEDISYMQEEERGVLAAVLALDEKYRVPIHLFYYEGYSIKEIAGITGEKAATVGTRLARGREILKKSLGGFDDESGNI